MTDTAVRQSKPQDKDYSITDGDGLSLFVSVRGVKSWHFRCFWHGKQPRISLGTYPETTLREARSLCEKSREIDPCAERKLAREAAGESLSNTFEAVAERWYAFRVPRLTVSAKGGVQ